MKECTQAFCSCAPDTLFLETLHEPCATSERIAELDP